MGGAAASARALLKTPVGCAGRGPVATARITEFSPALRAPFASRMKAAMLRVSLFPKRARIRRWHRPLQEGHQLSSRLIAPATEKQPAYKSGSVRRSGKVRAVTRRTARAVRGSTRGNLRRGERGNTPLLSAQHHHGYGKRDQYSSHPMSVPGIGGLISWLTRSIKERIRECITAHGEATFRKVVSR